MDQKFQLRFSSYESKKNYKVLNPKRILSIVEVQKILYELQKKCTSEIELSIEVTNTESGQKLEFTEIFIDPDYHNVELLEILQQQLIAAGDMIDGSKIYTELNRQYNQEILSNPAPPRQLRTYRKKDGGFFLLSKN